MGTLTQLAVGALRGRWTSPVDPLLRQLALRSSGLLAPSTTASRDALTACYRDGRPLLLGHRGARARAPENTMGAFRAALDDGADGVELDVTLSGDSVPIVLHDDTLDRTTNVFGKPSDFDADELASLDAASWFDGWPHAEGIPRLDHVLRSMPDGAVVNVELKGPSPQHAALERRVVDVVLAHTPRVNVIVSSRHPALLLEVRRIDPALPIAVIFWPNAILPLRTTWAVPLLGADAIHPPASVVDRAFVSAAHSAGLRVHVWGVADVDDGARLLDLGVDGLIVEDPAAYRRR